MKRISTFCGQALLLVFAVVPKVASATPPAATMQQETQQKAKIFSGTVIKNGDNFILSDAANKLSYVLDDPREGEPI